MSLPATLETVCQQIPEKLIGMLPSHSIMSLAASKPGILSREALAFHFLGLSVIPRMLQCSKCGKGCTRNKACVHWCLPVRIPFCRSCESTQFVTTKVVEFTLIQTMGMSRRRAQSARLKFTAARLRAPYRSNLYWAEQVKEFIRMGWGLGAGG